MMAIVIDAEHRELCFAPPNPYWNVDNGALQSEEWWSLKDLGVVFGSGKDSG